MAVNRDDAVRMVDLDQVAIATLLPRECDAAVPRRAHRCAHRSGVVDALVRAYQIEDRMMAAQVETRAHAGEFERRAQERLAQAPALRIVVTRPAVRRGIAHCL